MRATHVWGERRFAAGGMRRLRRLGERKLAFFRGDLATSSPESYSIEEMKAISEGMDASTEEVEAAIREDFNSLSPEAQGQMLDLLQLADPGNMRFWLELLGLAMPDEPLATA